MSSIEPTLAPPGAGLPRPEAWIARNLVFPIGLWRSTWASADQQFAVEGRRALEIFDALPDEARARPILIRRLQGLEDSSRNWSAAMTLEHLVIVGHAIRATIAKLRSGVRDLPAARIADVKPQGVTPPAQVRAKFEALLAEAASDPTPPSPRHGGPTADHPWFGPLNAFAWHYMLGMHQGIHRRQLEVIARQVRE